jgi:twitching motility protein PilJ
MKTHISTLLTDLRKLKTRLLLVLFAITLALVVVNLVFVNINSTEDQIYTQTSSDLRVLSQEISQSAAGAIAGSNQAFERLSASSDAFDAAWTLINQGADAQVDSGIGIRTRLAGRESDINNISPLAQPLWNQVRANSALVLANRGQIENLHQIARTASSTVPQLQRNYDELVNRLLDNNESLSTIAVAQRQTWLSERIALNLNRIVAGDDQAQAALEQFQRDIRLFSSNHDALLRGDASIGVNRIDQPAARQALLQISALFSAIEEQATVIIDAAPQIFRASDAVDAIVRDSALLLNEATALYQSFTLSRGDHLASPLVGYVLLLVILVLITLYGTEMIRQSRTAEKTAEEVNRRNNTAVLSLLEEISELAEGDLTVEATVSEDFTGAIADSINYAVGQLRELVSAINEVTIQVTQSTKSSAGTARHLLDASEKQTRTITSVTESVREMEKNINRVSDNAMKSLDVARNSVEIASGGAEVVKNTIQGMDTIRDQIQKTSQRIKRLGESSQEIGSFVSLINDIADHTNTLSLNAAIQAAMAGDAGKGFGVVADEVHALAERSTDATRKIESLVRVIQRDISEAVYSMEKTTAEVVQGTRLAQGAGAALDDIERVSKELAALVAEITEAARSQSTTASEITGSMEKIQQITTETSAGTKATSRFITDLAELTNRLHSAVSGFSLSRTEQRALHADSELSGSAERASAVLAYPDRAKDGSNRDFNVRGAVTA